MKDVAIIWGGPAGLLLSSYCKDNGIGFQTLERGKIGQSWRDMRPGMVLLSPAVPGTDWTSLTLSHPLWALPGTRRPFPTREDFLCHVDAFTRDCGLCVSERTLAVKARVVPGGFVVTTDAGDEIHSRFLVLATGASSVPRYPEIPGIDGNPSVIHSADFINCMAYDRKRVLVIGGGNSAAEICIELAGTADVTMCARNPLRYFSETSTLDDIRGSSESVLKELVRFRIITLREADPVVALSGGTAAVPRGRGGNVRPDRLRDRVSPPVASRGRRHDRNGGGRVSPHLARRGVVGSRVLLLRLAGEVPSPLRLHPRVPQLRREGLLGHRRPGVNAGYPR